MSKRKALRAFRLIVGEDAKSSLRNFSCQREVKSYAVFAGGNEFPRRGEGEWAEFSGQWSAGRILLKAVERRLFFQ